MWEALDPLSPRLIGFLYSMIQTSEAFRMSNITQAITKLNGAVGRLEASLGNLETSVSGQQRDMFGAPVKAKKNAGGFSENNTVIAQRLDKAIKKVEELLEG
jgi:hypothetical protein